MPKFIDAYQTTLGSRINTSKISEAISEAVIRTDLINSSLDVKKVGDLYPIFITPLHDLELNIPLFAHPYFYRTRDNRELLITDARLLIKKKGFDGTLMSLYSSLTSGGEYNFARSRAIINMKWIESDAESMKTNLWFSTTMFARWIGDILARAYALDGRDQIIINIVAAYYYQTLFTSETSYDEDTLQKWKIHISKAININDNKIMEEVFSKMPIITNVESLINAIKITTDNVRFNNFNIVSLLTLVKNSWYGNNGKEIITMALEHPPTWMCVINAAINEKTFKQSLICKLSEKVGKRGSAEEYTKEFHKILSEYSLGETHLSLANAGLI